MLPPRATILCEALSAIASSLPRLQILEISNPCKNIPSGCLPKLAALRRLKSLSITIHGYFEAPAEVSHLTSLTRLALRRFTPSSGGPPLDISSLVPMAANLRSLESGVVLSGLQHLSALSSITMFSYRTKALSPAQGEELWSNITHLRALKVLDLQDEYVQADTLVHLKTLSTVTELHLSIDGDEQGWVQNVRRQICGVIPPVRKLVLADIVTNVEKPQLTLEMALQLFSAAPLVRLDVCLLLVCPGHLNSPAQAQSSQQMLQSLMSLVAKGTTGQDDAIYPLIKIKMSAPDALAAVQQGYMQALHPLSSTSKPKLALRFTQALTLPGAQALAAAVPNLVSLDLSRVFGLDVATLQALCCGLTALRTLHLPRLPIPSSASIRAIERLGGTLKDLQFLVPEDAMDDVPAWQPSTTPTLPVLTKLSIKETLTHKRVNLASLHYLLHAAPEFREVHVSAKVEVAGGVEGGVKHQAQVLKQVLQCLGDCKFLFMDYLDVILVDDESQFNAKVLTKAMADALPQTRSLARQASAGNGVGQLVASGLVLARIFRRIGYQFVLTGVVLCKSRCVHSKSLQWSLCLCIARNTHKACRNAG